MDWAVRCVKGQKNVPESRRRPDFPKVVDDGLANLILEGELLQLPAFSSIYSQNLVVPIKIFEGEPGDFTASHPIN
jgi:hypothetical protein